MAVTPLDVYEAIEAGIVTALALAAVVALAWATLGRPLHRLMFSESEDNEGTKRGFFPRIIQRLERIEHSQVEAKRDQAEQSASINAKVDQVIKDQGQMGKDIRKLTEGQQAHAVAIAKLEGKEEARMEMAQGLGGASRIVEAMTHQQEGKE